MEEVTFELSLKSKVGNPDKQNWRGTTLGFVSEIGHPP